MTTQSTNSADDDTTSGLPGLIGHIGIWSTVVAAVVLSAVVAARGLIYLQGLPEVGVVALVTHTGPGLGLLLMTIASYISYYGTWRIVRRQDRYNVRDDLKSHAADIPAALASQGCLAALIPSLLAAALVAAALTYLPPAVRIVLGIGPGGPPPTPVAMSTPTAMISPTSTLPPTPAPTVTATPLSPGQLSYSPRQATTVDCYPGGGTVPYPAITLSNAGGQTLHWHASTTVSGTSVSPSSGALDPGKTWSLAVSQAAPAPVATNVTISSDAGTGVVQFVCAPHANLRISQNQAYSQSCNGTPAAYSITLDNSGSNVPVSWQFAATEFGGSIPWASAPSGTVAAFGNSSLQVTPQPFACPPIGTSWVRHATLNLAFPQGGSQANLAVSDTITGPAAVIKFAISPTQYPTDGTPFLCAPLTTQVPPPVVLQLDNTGSNVSVTWHATVRENMTTNTPWASVSKGSGTIAAGQTTQLTITPDNTTSGGVCAFSITPPYNLWHVDVTLQDGSTYTFTYRIEAFCIC